MNDTDTLCIFALWITSFYLFFIQVYYEVDEMKYIRKLGYRALVSVIIMAFIYLLLKILELMEI